MPGYYNGPPGIEAARTATHRLVFLTRSERFLPQGRKIAGACSRDPGQATADIGVLRNGLIMGRISTVVNSLGAVDSYAPSIFGVTTNAEAAGSTAIEASAAVVTEVVRRCGATGTFKLTGPPIASGVVTTETVTYSATSATSFTVTAILNAYIAGSFIQPTDGSETPVTFLPDWDYGLRVLDQDGTSITAVDYPKMPVEGIVDSSQLINWPTDTSLQDWIVTRLNDNAGGQYVFDHRY